MTDAVRPSENEPPGRASLAARYQAHIVDNNEWESIHDEVAEAVEIYEWLLAEARVWAEETRFALGSAENPGWEFPWEEP